MHREILKERCRNYDFRLVGLQWNILCENRHISLMSLYTSIGILMNVSALEQS
jgi:hypothetical protein